MTLRPKSCGSRRRRRSLALRLFGAALALATTAVPAVAQYQLVWEDDFNGTSLDLTKWQPMIGDGCPDLCGWGNNELQYYRAENATVVGGSLRITAKEETFGGRQYTSARLRTAGLGDWKYGRFEMRAKMPVGQGMWPAFWMLPTDSVYGVWAASGEMDVVEMVGQTPNRIFGTLHFGGTFPANTQSGGAYTLPSGTFADGFHRYAMEWDETEIRWYVDDVLYSTKTSWWSSGGPYPAPFDQRFHLLLNLAVGGNLPGAPNGSTSFPQSLEVDWVRVYQVPDHDPTDCECVFDDMEHADPPGNGWFTFDSATVGGSIAANELDSPPGVPGGVSLDAAWGGLFGQTGFYGGFGRTYPLDLTNATHFEFWIRPDPAQNYEIAVQLQDDDNGDGVIPSVPDGADDEFQYVITVGPPGSDVVSGGGWQRVSIPLADFVDDDSFHFGGNGVFDPTPTSAGGNGELVNVVFSLFSLSGAATTFRTDGWTFRQRAGGIEGRVWADENGNGVDDGEPGLAGLRLQLVDPGTGEVLDLAVTPTDGAYAFADLGEGGYTVRVDPATLPAGAIATFDPDGTASPGAFSLSIECDDVQTGLDFGYDPLYLGAPLCVPAEPNSTGNPGALIAEGSLLAANNDVLLSASSLPSGVLGYFLTSTVQGFVPSPGGSQGNLCVVGDIGRYTGPGQIISSGLLGTASLPIDLTQVPTPTGPVAVQPGETRYFQLWHRDANPGSTSNFTEAVGITFQ
ncbi:MAG: family 16 glycosylhydrolase [Planctomycetota bacterium]